MQSQRVNYPKTLLLASVLLLVSACGSDSNDDDNCSIIEVAGEADMLAALSLSKNPVTATDTLTVDVPIDSDTGFVQVSVLDTSTSSFSLVAVGGGSTTTMANQTFSVDIVMGTVSVPAPSGNHLVQVLLCADDLSCDDGVLYTLDLLGTSSNYWRGKLDPSGASAYTSYQNSCIALSRVEVQ